MPRPARAPAAADLIVLCLRGVSWRGWAGGGGGWRSRRVSTPAFGRLLTNARRCPLAASGFFFFFFFLLRFSGPVEAGVTAR
jgi:hypothetical protein